MVNETVAFFRAAFPAARQDFPSGCKIRLSLDRDLYDFDDMIRTVERHGGGGDLRARAAAAHAARPEHRRRHDRGLWDVLTEGEAFPWAADVARLHRAPTLIRGEGLPDIRAGEWIVEAKTLNYSEAEQPLQDRADRILAGDGIPVRPATDLRPLDDGFFRKLDADRVGEVGKERGATSQLAVFFEFDFDFGVTIRDRPKEFARIRDWARAAESESQFAVVAVYRHGWRAPLYPGVPWMG